MTKDQELEKAASEYAHPTPDYALRSDFDKAARDNREEGFIAGANWQKSRKPVGELEGIQADVQAIALIASNQRLKAALKAAQEFICRTDCWHESYGSNHGRPCKAATKALSTESKRGGS